jgi:hypothetical protein
MKCYLCRKNMEKDSPEDLEEMKTELEKNFPGVPVEECGIICDDCYNEIKKYRERFN